MPSPTSTDSNFERTFADLAYARLRDKAPSLLDFLIGFQLIDKNDEETHAIGVFGFKVGGEWVYAPVFFINGELKGHELMYIKNQDAFVPMTEEWVNYILNRRPAILGETEQTPRNQLGVRQPDFDLFARVPYIGSKYAVQHRSFNEILENIKDDFKPFMNVFTVSPKSEPKYAALDKRFNLPNALNVLGKQAARNLFKTMRADEGFADTILQFYTADELVGHEKTASKLTQQEAGYKPDAAYSLCKTCQNFKSGSCEVVEGSISANGTCHYYDGAKIKDDIRPIGPLDASEPLPIKTGSIRDGKESGGKNEMHEVVHDQAVYRDKIPAHPVVVVRGDNTSNMEMSLNEEDRRRLMREQYIVKDERSDDEKTRLYRSQLAATLSGPTESGMYNVMGRDGKTTKMAIITHPTRVGGKYQRKLAVCVAVNPEDKTFGNFDASDILVSGRLGDLDDLPGLVEASSLKQGDVAFLVGPRNKATNVFSVDNKVDLPDGSTELQIYGKLCPASSSSLTKRREYQSPLQEGEPDGADTIVLSDRKSNDSVQIGGSMFVPSSYKAFVLEKGKRDGGNMPMPSRDTASNLNIGSLSDLVMNVNKSASLMGGGVHQMRVLTDGIGFMLEINGAQGPRMSKLAMIKNLIVGQGLGQDDAELVIKEAAPKKGRVYWIKCAYNSQPNPAWFPEPIMGQEYGINAPVQYPTTMAQNLGPNDSLANREFYRDDRTLDQATKRLADQAGRTGQKEVLDTAVISGLVKTMDTDAAVDGYIGDLLLGLDRLGRILFMFYWHNDKFKERYGQQDMIELEDNLRNVFKQLGELALFL